MKNDNARIIVKKIDTLVAELEEFGIAFAEVMPEEDRAEMKEIASELQKLLEGKPMSKCITALALVSAAHIKHSSKILTKHHG